MDGSEAQAGLSYELRDARATTTRLRAWGRWSPHTLPGPLVSVYAMRNSTERAESAKRLPHITCYNMKFVTHHEKSE